MALRLLKSKRQQQAVNRRRVEKPKKYAEQARGVFDKAKSDRNAFRKKVMRDGTHHYSKYMSIAMADRVEAYKPISKSSLEKFVDTKPSKYRKNATPLVNNWNTLLKNYDIAHGNLKKATAADAKNRNIYNRNLSIEAQKVEVNKELTQRKRRGLGRFITALGLGTGNKNNSGGLNV